MRSRTDSAMREALGDFLGILEYKARHGVMSVEDVRSILAAIEASGGIKATVKEIAGYYHQSEDNVRHVIHRSLMPDPKRMVYYDFGAFRDKAVADSLGVDLEGETPAYLAGDSAMSLADIICRLGCDCRRD